MALAVQNIPVVFPEDPNWQVGKPGSRQSAAPVHGVVHAAKIDLRLAQVKHVVPSAHG
jgi:hypothetical protein